MSMRFQALILTQPSRAAMLSQLLAILTPQLTLRSEIVIGYFDEGISLGANRERMRREATADYIAFVDDDDLVPPDYISRILKALAANPAPDILGWEQVVYLNGVRLPQRDIHSITTVGWQNTAEAFYRDYSHLQPIRRDLALTVPMSGGYGEDRRWADGMRSAGVVTAESFLPLPPMYYYLSREPKDDAADATSPFRLSMIERVMESPEPSPSTPNPAPPALPRRTIDRPARG